MKRQFAILIDPDGMTPERLQAYLNAMQEVRPDMLLVGGSTGGEHLDMLVRQLRAATGVPVYLFPGNPGQLTHEADALLLLSLMSGNNPLFLTGMQIQAARTIQAAGLRCIPTAYLLVGNSPSTVARVSGTTPIPYEDEERILSTALAAIQAGKQAIYLEAGSGAALRVPARIINRVRQEITASQQEVWLIVGGGITSPDEVAEALAAGADTVVVGNYLERHPDQIPGFIKSLE